MTRIYAPEPQDVPLAPELPTLSALDAALNAAIDILEFQHDLHNDGTPQTLRARDVVDLAQQLRTVLRGYAKIALDL